MILSRSQALNSIKDQIGQNNHFLVTALIGLDVLSTNVGDVKSSFSPSWNPQNKRVSIDRSREYVLKTSLIWITDMLDNYFKILNRNPRYIEKIPLRKGLASETKISKKLTLFEENMPNLSKVDLAIVRLGICWRNKVTHSDGDVQELELQYCRTLKENSSFIKENFSGWEIERVLESYKDIQVNIQKNISGVIHAVHNLIYSIDYNLTKEISLERYIKTIVYMHFKKFGEKMANVWARDLEKKEKKIQQILLSHGFRSRESGVLAPTKDKNEISSRKKQKIQWFVEREIVDEELQQMVSKYYSLPFADVLADLSQFVSTFEDLPANEDKAQ